MRRSSKEETWCRANIWDNIWANRGPGIRVYLLSEKFLLICTVFPGNKVTDTSFFSPFISSFLFPFSPSFLRSSLWRISAIPVIYCHRANYTWGSGLKQWKPFFFLCFSTWGKAGWVIFLFHAVSWSGSTGVRECTSRWFIHRTDVWVLGVHQRLPSGGLQSLQVDPGLPLKPRKSTDFDLSSLNW